MGIREFIDDRKAEFSRRRLLNLEREKESLAKEAERLSKERNKQEELNKYRDRISDEKGKLQLMKRNSGTVFDRVASFAPKDPKGFSGIDTHSLDTPAGESKSIFEGSKLNWKL
jgi:hypothetical protein